MEHQVQGNRGSKDLKRQIANFEELVGNILSTGERAGGTNDTAMLDQLIAIHTAVEESDHEAIAQLAASGADLNAKFDDTVNAQHAGITPLALACATNRVDVVSCLLDNGADVNMPFAALNTTSLMTSAYHGHVDVVRVLLERGANVHMVDLQQSTALGYGFGGTRNLDVIQLLLNHDIDVNKKNILGMNALLLVAGYGNEALVEKILRAGADPNTVNDFGHSALHLTVVGKRDLLKKLRKLGTAEAVAADRSLNRRNLDVAIQEWARVHRDEVGGTPEDEAALAKAGAIMMSIGHQLEEGNNDDDDEQSPGAVLQKRVQAVWKHRQENIQKNKEKSKSGIWSLLSCGGGKSSKVDEKNAPASKPYTGTGDPKADATQKGPSDEYNKLSKSFARILRLLIDAGCHIDRTEKTFGMTALDLAILNGDVESSAVLTSAGADPNHFLRMLSLKELYQAIVAGQRKEVKELVQFDEHLDVNQTFSRFNVDLDSADEGTTPLTLAARQGDLEIVKMLIKKGSNVNYMGPAGRFPLAEASAKGDFKLATLLLQNNAELEKACPAMNEATPVTIASNMQHHKLVEFYIKKGAKVDRPMSDGRIALLRAFEARDMAMVDILLKQSTQPNFSDIQGLTAHIAAKYQSKDRDAEAILGEVANAVKEFRDEELAIEAETAAANEEQEERNNQVSFSEPPVFEDISHPAESQPQRREPPRQPVVEVQRVVHTQVVEMAPPSSEVAPPTMPHHHQPPPQPQRQPPPHPEVAPPVEPPRRRPVPEPTQPEVQFEVEERNVPPPVPITLPPLEIRAPVQEPESPVTPEQPIVKPAVVIRTKVESKEEEAQEEEEEEEEEGSSSEYETDTDEDEEEEEEEEEEAEEPASIEPARPGITVHKVENTTITTVTTTMNAPLAVSFAGETDIDAMDDPSPHETSDVNENVVKSETETTEEPASPNANSDHPPPLPVTSPPRESTETTI